MFVRASLITPGRMTEKQHVSPKAIHKPPSSEKSRSSPALPSSVGPPLSESQLDSSGMEMGNISVSLFTQDP